MLISSHDLWLLGEGTHARPYEVFGAHPQTDSAVAGTRFALWAPNARQVWVLGDFNDWKPEAHPMSLQGVSGIWAVFIPGAVRGQHYQFRIWQSHGAIVMKSDPYAFRTELRPKQASVIEGLQPPRPLAEQGVPQGFRAPVSIYEVHCASWRKADGWRWLTYDELAESLVPYAAKMGFTHLELLPVMEHPFDGSWGYQPVGLYAPTARHGTPGQFRQFVDCAHQHGLGVLLDWTPAHFPADLYGLARFDGTALYEHEDPREGYHPDWHTLIFNLGRPEVLNYLLGNALFWIEQYGIDGVRVDAVASMLYRDYSRPNGQWIANRFGGRENLESIAFLRKLNRRLGEEAPQAITIAEESTAFPLVSRPPSEDLEAGGLGFHYKWNLGWMHDILRYLARDPLYRKFHQRDLTFGLLYAFEENFVLALSHDEVVHGKGSLLGKMPGEHWQRFANLRALFGLMWAYPGKKLLFMGSEWASDSEWNHDSFLPWHLLAQGEHLGIQRLVKDLNAVYRAQAPLHQLDHEAAGFEWVAHDDHRQSVIAFLRNDLSGNAVLVVCHFTPVPRPAYRFGVSAEQRWEVILNTDDALYGGGASIPEAWIAQAVSEPWHGKPFSLAIDLPPLAVLWLRPCAA
jgi:1,4-alpha-glucan branching enzyme